MRTIHKTILKPVPYTSRSAMRIIIDLPMGAKVLYAREQGAWERGNQEVCVWYETDTMIKATEKRTFAVFGTGHELDIEDWQWRNIGMAHMHGGSLVFHIYEKVMLND